MGFDEEDDDIIRSSRTQMFLKIDNLKNFVIFKGKHSTQVFSCEYCEFLRTFLLQKNVGGRFFIILLLLLHPSSYLIRLDFFFWRKCYVDFFADVFFYLNNFYSYFRAITRL